MLFVRSIVSNEAAGLQLILGIMEDKMETIIAGFKLGLYSGYMEIMVCCSRVEGLGRSQNLSPQSKAQTFPQKAPFSPRSLRGNV